MKSFFKIILLIIFLLLLGVWSPWRSFNVDLGFLFGVKKVEQVSGLQVYSLAGDMDIYIDSELKGRVTPETSPVFVDAINPGDRKVTLSRPSLVEGAYLNFDKIITFVPGVDIVISYGLGPNEFFSEGSVITLNTKVNETYNLVVNTNVEGATIVVDGIPSQIPDSRLVSNIALDRQISISIQKAGYETISLTLLPEDEADRQNLAGYIINVDVHMMLLPFEII